MLLDKRDPFRYCAWIPAAVLLLSAWIGILLDIQSPRSRGDQDQYHLPAILKFASELPKPDLKDYKSATTPGYHLVMATVWRLMGEHPRTLRGIGSLFSGALLVVLGVRLARRVGGPFAMAMAFPMALNLYVYGAAVWLLPDNAGWLFVLLVLIWIFHEPFEGKTAWVGGLLILLLVLVRQAHLWICAPFLMAAWMGGKENRLSRMVQAALSLIPALAALAIFFVMWGGTTPPEFLDSHQHMNYATPAMILASALLPGAGFISLLAGRWSLLRARWIWIFMGTVLGFAIGTIPATSYHYFAGRYSGWWNLAERFPIIWLNHSTVIMAMSTAGGALIGAYLAAMPKQRDVILFAGILGAFILGNMAGALSFQRYYDPMLLMVFPLMATRAMEGEENLGKARLIGPILLSLATLGITALFISGS